MYIIFVEGQTDGWLWLVGLSGSTVSLAHKNILHVRMQNNTPNYIYSVNILLNIRLCERARSADCKFERTHTSTFTTSIHIHTQCTVYSGFLSRWKMIRNPGNLMNENKKPWNFHWSAQYAPNAFLIFVIQDAILKIEWPLLSPAFQMVACRRDINRLKCVQRCWQMMWVCVSVLKATMYL